MLCELLVDASNEDGQERSRCLSALLEMTEQNPQSLAADLIEVLSKGTTAITSISFVILTKIVREDVLTSDQYHAICTVCEKFFEEEDPHLACVLFALSMSHLDGQPIGAELLQQISRAIESSQSEVYILNMFKVIRIIAEESLCESSQWNAVVHQLLVYYERPSLRTAVIAIVEKMNNAFMKHLDANEQIALIQNLLQGIRNGDETKAACFRCLKALLKHCWVLMEHYLWDIVSVVSTGLETMDEAVLPALSVVKTLCVRQITSNSLLLNFRFFDMMFKPLLHIAMSPPTEEPDPPEYWGPHLAARQTLSVFTVMYTDHACKVMIDNLESMFASSWKEQEVAYIFLETILRSVDRELSIDEVIPVIAFGIDNDNARVRLAAVNALSAASVYFNQCFVDLYEPLMKLLTDNQMIAMAVLKCFRHMALTPNCALENVCSVFFQMVSYPDLEVCRTSLNQLSKVIASTKEIGSLSCLIEPTIELIREGVDSPEMYQEYICYIPYLLISRLDDEILPFAETIWSVLSAYNTYVKFLPLISLAVKIGDILEFKNQAFQYLVTSMESCRYEHDIELCCAAVSIATQGETQEVTMFIPRLLKFVWDENLRYETRSIVAETIAYVIECCKSVEQFQDELLRLVSSQLFFISDLIISRHMLKETYSDIWFQLGLSTLQRWNSSMDVESIQECFNFLLALDVHILRELYETIPVIKELLDFAKLDENASEEAQTIESLVCNI